MDIGADARELWIQPVEPVPESTAVRTCCSRHEGARENQQQGQSLHKILSLFADNTRACAFQGFDPGVIPRNMFSLVPTRLSRGSSRLTTWLRGGSAAGHNTRNSAPLSPFK